MSVMTSRLLDRACKPHLHISKAPACAHMLYIQPAHRTEDAAQTAPAKPSSFSCRFVASTFSDMSMPKGRRLAREAESSDLIFDL